MLAGGGVVGTGGSHPVVAIPGLRRKEGGRISPGMCPSTRYFGVLEPSLARVEDGDRKTEIAAIQPSRLTKSRLTIRMDPGWIPLRALARPYFLVRPKQLEQHRDWLSWGPAKPYFQVSFCPELRLSDATLQGQWEEAVELLLAAAAAACFWGEGCSRPLPLSTGSWSHPSPSLLSPLIPGIFLPCAPPHCLFLSRALSPVTFRQAPSIASIGWRQILPPLLSIFRACVVLYLFRSVPSVHLPGQ
ncbi:uncharacterized protein BO96DRAFT_436648 [Aspergillus niger CBS 101883]|uniref:Uncharacterized protein n=2 Tax=Aspergillus niger TaxID=5061 RepID=A2R2J0_ASPNC|nr:uncharacterized protein BO96DRAFT_436648 [Aspergillus niger CBS 101883]XP_059602250.1 hypothetical protein An14g00910 [Aspergillus niger]PYH53734.1 hypothetical protein BO96DRAFT_436648 [Aspergillus niger CBS 101883]CAK41890.1 hypothetical protein An14g00910 [Aspergillus niger]